jgi:hypothetical protein
MYYFRTPLISQTTPSNELEKKKWEGSGRCLIEVRLTSPKFSGVDEKKHENPQPRYSLSRQRYKLGTSPTPGQRFCGTSTSQVVKHYL